MRWLHLSDIHIGRPGPSAQVTALEQMLERIRVLVDERPVAAVFITGDVAYAGKREQYLEAEASLIGPLRQMPGLQGARIFVAPGNHDLDCEIGVPPAWTNIGARRQAEFFEESEPGRRLRAQRALCFAEYAKFLSRNQLEGPNPEESVSGLFDVDGYGIAITNTAFFCDKDVQDREAIPSPQLSIEMTLRGATGKRRLLILGHHPIDWFIREHRRPFESMLHARKAIYLHGHTHELDIDFGPEGPYIVGFGASYQAPHIAPPSPYYRNSFALCELEDSKLLVAPYHWDSVNGAWICTNDVPPGFRLRSSSNPDTWEFALDKEARPPARGIPPSVGGLGKTARISALGTLDAADWQTFIGFARLLPVDVPAAQLTAKTAPAGEHYFEFKLPAGLHYVHCIEGAGTHLSHSRVEDINTKLDTEGYLSYTLVTLGTLADDAETLYERLRTRKAISIFAAKELVSRMAGIAGFAQQLGANQAAVADSDFVLSQGRRPVLLIQDRTKASWFSVSGPDGQAYGEADPLVVKLRQVRPELKNATYRIGVTPAPQPLPRPQFDRDAYLAACRSEFQAVRYAALATMGLRFPGVTLEDLYVETGAQSEASGDREAVSTAIDDLLTGARVEGVLKDELSASNAADLFRGEHLSARALYKHHGSLVVLGDPGSGKTCFVKREMLAYCSGRDNSWYERHIPLYLPLAEVAAHVGDDTEIDLLAVAVDLSKRRGAELELDYVKAMFARGQTALFYDGLDEVVAVELRSKILSAIKSQVEAGRPLGNRFVLTSRPAAIHHSELPRHIEVVRMRGLTDREMRLLAERILAARVSETKGSVHFDVSSLSPADLSTLEALLADCRLKPGIDRLARNPLFLTLLVMIYANSGAASARRHRVYAQAVSTLVTVRARDAGQRGLSEVDLRRRLGAVALSVFRDPRAAMPTHAGVVDVLRREMEKERCEGVGYEEASQYLQDVAEATGLVSIHGDSTRMVTFMHHSFLEYYAAVGLSLSENLAEVGTLARTPRWRDVITLLAGIVSDSGDPARVVLDILALRDTFESLTMECATLALDCALECDVPPDRVVRALVARIHDSIVNGNLKHDASLRVQIGVRIGKLLTVTNSPVLLGALVAGVADQDDDVSAAYIDVAGHAATEADLGQVLVKAIEAAAGRSVTCILKAVCAACARSPQLRTAPLITTVERSLVGVVELRRAAVAAVHQAPSLGRNAIAALKENIEESSFALAELASQALLRVAAVDALVSEDPEWLAKALRRISESSSLAVADDIALSMERGSIEELLRAGEKKQRLLGIRLLPWVANAAPFVHDRLMQSVRATDREERVVALESLRIAKTALMLVTVPDTYELRGLLDKSHTKDVRLAAARVLGTAGFEDSDIVRDLVDFARTATDTSQFEAAVGVLAGAAETSDVVQEFLVSEAGALLAGASQYATETTARLHTVLRVLDGMDIDAHPRLASMLRRVVDDYKYSIELRRAALCGYVSVSRVADCAAHMKALLRQAPVRLGHGLIVAVSRFVAKCRRRLEYMTAVYGELQSLEDALLGYYGGAMTQMGVDKETVVTTTRAALTDIRHMMTSYREYSQRVPIPQSSLFVV